MNLLTSLANYGLESITFPSWLFTLCHFSILSPCCFINPSHLAALSRLIGLLCLETASPLCVSITHFAIPLSDPTPLPSFPSIPRDPLFPPRRNPHLISLNLFPSLRVSVRPRCDPGDISTVTPVTLHRGGHCPPCTTQRTEVPLIWECNAHTDRGGGVGGGSGGVSAFHLKILFCMPSVGFIAYARGRTRRRDRWNERASNYMTDLASGSL